VLAIQKRREEDPSEGVISIAITKESPPPDQEVLLNTAWVVSIRDNGHGVTAEQLAELNRFDPGTRFRQDHGQGLGLVAAQRYIASIGGRIELKSEFTKFFEVVLQFDEGEEIDKRE
jgi:signal transduction histidine kinase